MLELRPEVRAFAEAMERRLRANDHKGGWKKESAFHYLFPQLIEETGELAAVISADQDFMAAKRLPVRRDLLLAEAADVGNFAMMIADVCGALPQEAEG